MIRFTCAGCLLAVSIGGYGSAANGQEACRQQVEELQGRVQESALDAQTKGRIEDLLDTAQSEGGGECQSIVMDVREQLDTARIPEPRSGEAVEQSDTHVVESETFAVTAPTEQTDAEITIEEPLDERGERGNASGDAAGPGAQAEGGQPPQGNAIREAEGGAIGEGRAPVLVGRELKSRDGEDVGRISGVARSVADRQLHAVVDAGGFLGVGERAVAIPLERAQVDQDGSVVTQMSRDEIEELEEYDPARYASIDEEGDRSLR